MDARFRKKRVRRARNIIKIIVFLGMDKKYQNSNLKTKVSFFDHFKISLILPFAIYFYHILLQNRIKFIYNTLMVLSDRDIKKYLKNKKIIINPSIDFTSQLGSCSVDLRLGNIFRIFEHSKYPYIDPLNKRVKQEVTREITVKDGEAFILQPSDFVLASTIESFKLSDDLLARLEGRSSLGRLGIVVHSTASIFDPGWEGVVVMELGNMGRMPVALYPSMRICSLSFEQLSSPAQVPYYKKQGAKYVKQKGPEESRIKEE